MKSAGNIWPLSEDMIFRTAARIDAPLSRKPGSIIERIVDKDHGERAVTHYRVVKKENGTALFP